MPHLCLCHLKPEIVVEKAHVTHLECCLHFCLEHVDVSLVPSSDHKIIHINTHDNTATAFAAELDSMLRRTPLEAEVDQRLIQLGVPGTRGLTESIESFDEVEYLAFVPLEHKT